MNRFALTLFTAAALAAALVPTSEAEAQCTGYETFCADVSVGTSFSANAQLVVNRPQRAAQVVVVQPAPPAPPPPPVQPPVVIVQPVQPVQPPPQQATVVVTTETMPPPQQVVVTTTQRQVRPTNVGIHGQISGIFGSDLQMVGGELAFRLRPHNGVFALDIGGGSYWGTDYNGLDRNEWVGTVDGLFFFNPQNRLQLYGVLGVGASYAQADGVNRFTGDFTSRDYSYLGGQAGIGLEFRFGRRFAMNVDVRGFVRTRVDGNPQPEFEEFNDLGLRTGRTTNTSGGVTANLGATFYF